MDESYDYLEELEDFLAGTFHQDISSPEQALDEFVNEASKECLLFTVKYCDECLNSKISKQEKESIIENNAKIYFPAIELTPLQWLSNLEEQIKEVMKTRKP